MKTLVKISAILSFLAALVLLGLSTTGCAMLPGSKIQTDAQAALTSADLSEAAGIGLSIASKNYEEAFKGVVAYAKRVKAAKARANGAEITEAQASDALKALGYEVSKTVFFDGIAVNDLKRITWEKKLVQTGSGAGTEIEDVVAAGDGATVDSADEIDWMDVILKQAEENGLKLE